MHTYSVTLYPTPEATADEMTNVLSEIQALQGILPGLASVVIQDFTANARQETYSFTMYFDSQEHLISYNTQPAYLPVGKEINRLCPTAVVSSVSIISHSIRIIEHPKRG